MPLVLRLRAPVGRLRRAAGCGFHPSPGRHRGVGRRCALHRRATTRQATVVVSRVGARLRVLGCDQHALVHRSGRHANAVADLPAARAPGVLIWEIAWSPQRTRALLAAYVLGVAVAAIAIVGDYLSGVHAAGYEGRFNALSVNPNELG